MPSEKFKLSTQLGMLQMLPLTHLKDLMNLANLTGDFCDGHIPFFNDGFIEPQRIFRP